MMIAINKSSLSSIIEYTRKPPLYAPGELRFWDDSHISKGMLAAHLNPDNDAASRKHATIDREVRHLISSDVLKKGDRLLDLGCGPGLYSSRLCKNGLMVTGIDISTRSLEYAAQYAEENGLKIDYRLMNFFDIRFSGEFDAVLQTNGELNTFSDEKRDDLLARLHRALKPGGLLIFDITTREMRLKNALSNAWYAVESGYWRPGPHLVLEQGFDYPEHNVALNQYIVIDNERVAVYRCWFHDYTLDAIRQVLENAGFEIMHAWNGLDGTPYREGGDWIAIVARKR